MKPLVKYHTDKFGILLGNNSSTHPDKEFYLASDIDPLLASHGKLVEIAVRALKCWIDHEGKSCFLMGVDGWCGECARCVTKDALALLAAAEVEP